MIENDATTDVDYYNHLRPALASLFPRGAARVLDIGCGTGRTLERFKELGSTETVGIELREDVAAIARRNPAVSRIFVGDFLNLELPYADGFFDVVVASFVLEHVADPWVAVKRIRSLLSPKGVLIGSLPNVRHLSVSVPLLLRGRWEYQPQGIMDWTHLRFFTRSTIEQLMSESGFSVERMDAEIVGLKNRVVHAMTLGLFPDLCGYAFNFVARPLGP